jgi:hypothetical protein
MSTDPELELEVQVLTVELRNTLEFHSQAGTSTNLTVKSATTKTQLKFATVIWSASTTWTVVRITSEARLPITSRTWSDWESKDSVSMLPSTCGPVTFKQFR